MTVARAGLLLLLICGIALKARTAGPLPATQASVRLDSASAGPRQVEEQTERTVMRDYGAAWLALCEALGQNRAERLQPLWTGSARQRFAEAIDQQKRTGVQVRYVDRGHQLSAVFYSPEGSALELRDTAQLERQLFDSGKLVDTESVTGHYLVIMTPSADGWQIRSLESLPK